MVEGAEALVKNKLTDGRRRKAPGGTPHTALTDDVERLALELNARFNQFGLASTAEIRKVRREFSKRLKHESPELVKQLALRLVRNASLPRFFAYELILNDKQALGSIDSDSLEQLGSGIQSWGEVDAFACYVAGPAWRERHVPDSLIKRWAVSDDRWWRRAAVVSTVALNNKARGGSGDVMRTLLICKLVIRDRDDMVVKSLSWALRELSKRDSNAVREFLDANEGSLAARVLREVKNKLSTGLKNPRKAAVG
jgi:3-methyladenine DNA glycosylase AlkD